MRLLADLHISPSTVSFLRSLGHDIIRLTAALPPTADDAEIIAYAAQENRTIITQDLDFSAIIALTRSKAPSLISLRLSSSRIEYVNALLLKILPTLEQDVLNGMIVTVEDHRVRRRALPIS
jgi:predicted nuclease of predicted toxin-antitoxin system